MFKKKVTQEEFQKYKDFYDGNVKTENENWERVHDKLDKLAKALGYEWRSKAEKKMVSIHTPCLGLHIGEREEAILVWDWEKVEGRRLANSLDEMVFDSQLFINDLNRFGGRIRGIDPSTGYVGKWNDIEPTPKRKYTKRKKVAKEK